MAPMFLPYILTPLMLFNAPGEAHARTHHVFVRSSNVKHAPSLALDDSLALANLILQALAILVAVIVAVPTIVWMIKGRLSLFFGTSMPDGLVLNMPHEQDTDLELRQTTSIETHQTSLDHEPQSPEASVA